MNSSKRSKEFHKYKKAIYKTSIHEYLDFLEKCELESNGTFSHLKLEKQDFSNEQVTSELELYIKKILNILEILSYNLSLEIRMIENPKELEDHVVLKLNSYANSINELCHIKLFNNNQNLNQVEILLTLVIAMKLAIRKELVHVDLNVYSHV